MKTMYKLSLLAGILFSGATILNSCSKADAIDSLQENSNASAMKATSNSLFDRDLVVTMAKDDGADITANFAGLTFHFNSMDAPAGVANVWNDVLNVHGSYGMSESTITFSYPTDIFSQLTFMNKSWLVPTVVGTSGPITLTAANGENDSVQFSAK